ncbi:MAG: hypothetical protein ABFD64_08950 [Armatimonadota bacterium]
MNALPTGPYEVADLAGLQQYFLDVERLNFDIACNSYCSIPLKDVTESLLLPYRRFASEAKSRGYKACIYINSIISCGDAVGITEAQYRLDNSPARLSDNCFHASLASTDWRNYLKELTRLFVQDYGYTCVIFADPMQCIDIPGTMDRFYERFLSAYPDVSYPKERSETPEYLKLQQLKADVLIDFCRDLSSHAKSVGAEQVGVMPRMFTPDAEIAHEGTLSTCCESGRIAALPDVDFLAVRLNLDDIYAGNLRTGDEMERSPLICYAEVLSHCVGKPVMAMISTEKECGKQTNTSQIPQEFVDKALLASTAAAPNGLMAKWTGTVNDQSVIRSNFLSKSNRMLERTGLQRTPIAFVISETGLRHAEPYSYKTVWQFYWQIARRILYCEKQPMLTLCAEALEENLSMNPQVSILLLEEHFPLTKLQIDFLERWWTDAPGRSIVIIGSGTGFSADPDKPGLQPISESFPGLLDKLGIKQESPYTINTEKGNKVILKRRYCDHSALPPDEIELDEAGIANSRRIFGSHNNVMYSDSNDRPVITKWSSGSSLGFFCGLDSHSAAPIVARIIRYALHAHKAFLSPVTSSDDNMVLWNGTRDGYILAVNFSDNTADLSVHRPPYTYWDVLEQRLVRDSKVELKMPPSSMRTYKWTNKTAKLYDVVQAVHIKSIAAGAGRAEIVLTTGQKTAFIVRNEPREILVDGSAAQFHVERSGPFCVVKPVGVKPGDHIIILRW